MSAFDMGSFLGLRDAETLKQVIFDGIKEIGGDYAEASYDGGNDEGGINGLAVYRRFEEDGEEKKLALDTGIDIGRGGWEQPLWAAFDELLSHDFGTWAGEFSASGYVFADLREKRIWRQGEMSTYISDDSAGEY